MIFTAIVLAGCEKETLTINDLEYVRIVETDRGDLVIFEKEDGKEKILYVDSSEKNIVFSMEIGKIYNVTFTAETVTEYGDFLVSAELVK